MGTVQLTIAVMRRYGAANGSTARNRWPSAETAQYWWDGASRADNARTPTSMVLSRTVTDTAVMVAGQNSHGRPAIIGAAARRR